MRTISDVYLSDATFFSQLIFGGNIHWTTLIIKIFWTSKRNAALPPAPRVRYRVRY